MKIHTILGARPQFIKASSLSREFRKHPDICEVILHTGQHFDENMSEVFFREMDIPEPAYNLNINSLSHGAITGQMLIEIEKILLADKPDYVLVYGDTNTTLAGALAAKKLGISVIHVEAGLRSYNMLMPEEINRILTDRISDILFCPTKESVNNLKKEGFENFDAEIILSGDVMQDAALFYAGIAEGRSSVIHDLGLETGRYLLCTMHRAENTDNEHNLIHIITALNKLSEQFRIVLPLHPRTRKIIESKNLELKFSPIEPVGYFDMLNLIRHSRVILTDSGGLQKEAYFFSKYCITMRDQTEWIELVNNRVNSLVGADTGAIIAAVQALADKPFPEKTDLYGNGHACSVICRSILKHAN